MTDSIARLWAYEPNQHKGVVFPRLNQPKGDVPLWVFKVFNLFGRAPDHVLIVNEPAVFEQLEFVTPGSVLGEGPAAWYLDILKRLPLDLTHDTPRHLYLGRTHMIDRGTVMGETYFSRLLQANGFTEFYPEVHDIHTQAAALANADRIVFMEGSSIYTIELLAKTNAQIFMIPPRRGGVKLFAPHIQPRADFRVLAGQREIKRRPNRSGVQRPNSPSYFLRPDLLFRELLECGLIANQRFSLQEFEKAEREDAKIYFESNTPMLEKELQEICETRQVLDTGYTPTTSNTETPH